VKVEFFIINIIQDCVSWPSRKFKWRDLFGINNLSFILWNTYYFHRFFLTLFFLVIEMYRQLDRVKCKLIWSISHYLFINNYMKYLIIKSSLLKKSSKKAKNEIITQYLTGATVV
jgi:hypothetical protein